MTSALARAALARKQAAVRRDARPLYTWAPLPKQYAMLSSPHRRRLLRAGNQWGKTTAGAVDLIAHVTGHNPWCPEMETPHASEAWVICASWSQSVVIQQKLHELIPKHLLHPETVFDELRGFRGKNPAFRILHRDGNYSTVRVKTMGQGGLRLASATIGYAWFDEPPTSSRIYSEITKRVMRAGRYGRVLITMTPVNAAVEWLREMVEPSEGKPILIEDHHSRFEPESFVPMMLAGDGRWVLGSEPMQLADGTLCDGAWVEGQISDTLPHEVPVVCHGEWRFRADAPVFPAFRTSGHKSHVNTTLPQGEARLFLGIDHGIATHTQVAVLCAVLDWEDTYPKVWVLDTWVGTWATTEDDDAAGILSMIERNGITWAELDDVRGDRAHHGAPAKKSVAVKSNERLMKALQRQPRAGAHGIETKGKMSRPIAPAKQMISNTAPAKDWGCTWLHRAMVRDLFNVHPRCTEMIAAIPAYDGKQNTKESHWIDALRYALRSVIFAKKHRAEMLRVHV